MKKHFFNIHPLIRLSGLLLLAFSLSACSLSKVTHLNNYEDYAQVANTFWANLYVKIMKPKIPHYKQLIYKDTHWKQKHSPYVVSGNMLVLPGVTLTIDPGVKIILKKDETLRCQGIVVAKGTESEPIVFTREDDDTYWEAIEFNNCIPAPGSENSHVILKHCIIEYGKGVIVNSSEAEITDCIFRENISTAIKFEYASGVISGNKIYNNSTERQCETGNGAGINVYSDSFVRIEGNTVYDNFSHGGRDGGGGIYAFAYNEGKVFVRNNIVRNNVSDRKAGGIFAFASEVTGNTVINNRSELYGGGIFTISSVLKDNVVTGNRSRDGGGIYSENCQLEYNLIQDNTAEKGTGLYHLGDGTIRGNTITGNKGLQPDTSAAITLSGNPLLEDNNIIASNGYALKFLSHSLSPDLKAANNYWGTADAVVIEKLIYDWLEDSEVGLVSWKPYRRTPSENAYAVMGFKNLKTAVTAEPTAPGTIRGMIETDTTLGQNGTKAYTVTGNLLVLEGVLLDLAPGCKLFLNDGVTIRIRGQMTAVGDNQNMIRFTGDPQHPWGRIFFENRSLDVADQAVTARTQNTFRNCVIENGGGVLMDGYGVDIIDCIIRDNHGTGIRIKESEAKIKNCTIQNNSSNTDGGGIYVYGSKNVIIHDNRITGNTAADGGGIFAYGYLTNVAVDIRHNNVENNTSLGDGGGIWTSRTAVVDNKIVDNHTEDKGGGIFASFALINQNLINDNKAQQGGGVFAEANSTIYDNIIAGNTIKGKMGAGAFLNYWGVSMHNKKFCGNIIEDNVASGNDNTGGLVMNGKMSFGGNVIRQNSGFQLFNRNPADIDEITARNCYWETTDDDQISRLIWDGLDDPALSIVDYSPIALSKEAALVKGKELYEAEEEK